MVADQRTFKIGEKNLGAVSRMEEVKNVILRNLQIPADFKVAFCIRVFDGLLWISCRRMMHLRPSYEIEVKKVNEVEYYNKRNDVGKVVPYVGLFKDIPATECKIDRCENKSQKRYRHYPKSDLKHRIPKNGVVFGHSAFDQAGNPVNDFD